MLKALLALAATLTLVWVLNTKREPTSAIAWCLLVIFLPILGVFLFQIRERFDSLDIHHLEKLRED